MSIDDAINITIASGVAITVMYFLPFFLIFCRRQPDAENESRSGRFSTVRPIGTSGVYGNGIAMAVIALTMMLLGVIVGYMWFWGLAAYGCIWIGIMTNSMTRRYPPRCHKSVRLLVLGCFVLAIALGLAWTGYCEWIDFPLVLFIALCALATAVFLYVAVKRISDS